MEPPPLPPHAPGPEAEPHDRRARAEREGRGVEPAEDDPADPARARWQILARSLEAVLLPADPLIEVGAKFCSNCGAVLQAAAEPAVAEAAPLPSPSAGPRLVGT